MKKIDNASIGLVKNLSGGRSGSEVSRNDDNPLVMTLRNTLKVLLGRPKKTEEGVNLGKSFLSKLPVKGLMVAIGGIAALLVGKDALAGTWEAPAGDNKPNPDTDRPKESVSEPSPEADKLTAEVNDSIEKELEGRKVEKGPASSKPISPRVESSKRRDTPLTKGKSNMESVDSAISRAAKATGENASWLRALIHLESGGDPRARSTQYLGLGQIGKTAWEDVTGSGLKLPALTGGADDPRYDPYLNALATAKLMSINRKRISTASKKAGYPEPTLGLLYAAHNLGAGSINKMLAESDSDKWDAQTKRYVANQASELTKGGIGNYLKNAEASMRSHYAAANEGVGATQIATADSLGVMSSVAPRLLAARQRTEAPVQIAANEGNRLAAAASTSTKVKAPTVKVATAEQAVEDAPQQGGGTPQGDTARQKTEEPFRLANGKLASA